MYIETHVYISGTSLLDSQCLCISSSHQLLLVHYFEKVSVKSYLDGLTYLVKIPFRKIITSVLHSLIQPSLVVSNWSVF